MSEIEDILKDFLPLEEITEISFKKVCGFYFAYRTTDIIIKDEISSIQITPVAIIYEENGEFYLAPIDGEDKIEEIVKSFAEKCLSKKE